MTIVEWIIVGGLVGVVATTLSRRRRAVAVSLTVPIAIIGAVLGGFVGDSVDFGDVESSFDLESFAAAAAGSLVMLAAYRAGGGRI